MEFIIKIIIALHVVAITVTGQQGGYGGGGGGYPSMDQNQVQNSKQSKPIGGDLESTLKITVRLCYNPKYHTEDIARRFFDCYDEAPGKPQFVACQQRVWGGCLNNIPRIDYVCNHPTGAEILARYVQCIGEEFKKNGVNYEEALTKVNICEAKVLEFL